MSDSSVTAGSLSKQDFSETKEFLESSLREYMHARHVLSTMPKYALKKVYRQFEKQPRRRKDEQELLHRMVAALHLYESEGVACASSQSDFCSGLMATAASEGLAIVGLIQQKANLRKNAKYKELWKRAQERARKGGGIPTFSQFLLELRFDDLFRLAREVGLYDEHDLPKQVDEALNFYGYAGRLTNFVRKARNCIHPRWNLHANDSYANPFGIYYSLESMKRFHIDFALCAWTLNGLVGNGLKSEKLIRKTDNKS